MENKRFVLPLTMGNKAYFVEAEIVISKKTGLVSVSTDMHYNPLVDHEDYVSGYEMNAEVAEKMLENLGFIAVSEDFNQREIESLRTIKHLLSPEWIENYNLWVGY